MTRLVTWAFRSADAEESVRRSSPKMRLPTHHFERAIPMITNRLKKPRPAANGPAPLPQRAFEQVKAGRKSMQDGRIRNLVRTHGFYSDGLAETFLTIIG